MTAGPGTARAARSRRDPAVTRHLGSAPERGQRPTRDAGGRGLTRVGGAEREAGSDVCGRGRDDCGGRVWRGAFIECVWAGPGGEGLTSVGGAETRWGAGPGEGRLPNCVSVADRARRGCRTGAVPIEGRGLACVGGAMRAELGTGAGGRGLGWGCSRPRPQVAEKVGCPGASSFSSPVARHLSLGSVSCRPPSLAPSLLRPVSKTSGYGSYISWWNWKTLIRSSIPIPSSRKPSLTSQP